jgi:hypothetical protein
MKTDAYTPDAICRSLGIGPFNETWTRGRPLSQFRLLLCPSFDPEVFLSVEEVNGKLFASVNIARTHIWRLSQPGTVTCDRATTELVNLTFNDLEQEFRSALADNAQAVVVIDGMRMHAVLHMYSRVIQIDDNPGTGSALGRFVATLIDRVYTATENVRCRNGLARAGRYVGLKLAMEPEAELPEVTTMVVLGTAEEQEDMLSALASVSARRDKLHNDAE